jgi:hypothetical protein
MERHWLVRVGTRRANREQRAMFAGGHAAVELGARERRVIRIRVFESAVEGSREV